MSDKETILSGSGTHRISLEAGQSVARRHVPEKTKQPALPADAAVRDPNLTERDDASVGNQTQPEAASGTVLSGTHNNRAGASDARVDCVETPNPLSADTASRGILERIARLREANRSVRRSLDQLRQSDPTDRSHSFPNLETPTV